MDETLRARLEIDRHGRTLQNGAGGTRPAIAFWRHHPVIDQQAIPFAEATLRFHETVGGDFIKLNPSGTYQAASLGVEDAWQGDLLGRRTVTHRPIDTPADWNNVTFGDLGSQEEDILRVAEWLRHRVDGDMPVVATIFSPVTQAIQLTGAEAFPAHLQAAPAAILGFLNGVTARILGYLDMLEAAGIDGVFYVAQHFDADLGLGPLLTPEFFAGDARIFERSAQLPLKIVHLHGAALASGLPTLPPDWIVHYELTDQNPTLSDMARTCSPRLAAGLPNALLLEARSPDQCRTIWNARIGDDARHVALLSAGCVLPMGFPLACARRWVDAVRSWDA